MQCRTDSVRAFGTGPPSVPRRPGRSANSPWRTSTATASRPHTGTDLFERRRTLMQQWADYLAATAEDPFRAAASQCVEAIAVWKKPPSEPSPVARVRLPLSNAPRRARRAIRELLHGDGVVFPPSTAASSSTAPFGVMREFKIGAVLLQLPRLGRRVLPPVEEALPHVADRPLHLAGLPSLLSKSMIDQSIV